MRREKMKKLTLLLAIVMILGLVVSASAIDQKGKVAIGAYGGYGFGFGDVFKKYEFGDYSVQNKITFCFGAKVKYGLTPNVALAGAIDYQGGKAEAKGDFAGFDLSGSESWHWMAILANAVYVFSPEAKTSPYVTAGGGFYIPSQEGADSKPGVNAGIGVEHFFQPNLALDAGARFHMIFTEDKSTTYAQILVGVIYYLGVE
jgi:opacity protein-like surface antigen